VPEEEEQQNIYIKKHINLSVPLIYINA
jgi:hypothetical protein